MQRRDLMLTLAAMLSTCFSARAEADTRSYAVMSLIGDKMNVVTYQMTTGSNLDRNLRQSVDVGDAVFDKAALRAALAALTGKNIDARVQLFMPTDPSLFSHQDRFFDGDKVTLPEAVDSALKTDGATHLLLVTKYRGDALLKADHWSLGSGKLEGLGFYVDRVTPMRRSDTRERGIGFLAPFVYIRLSLVDLKAAVVVREQVVTASATLSAAQAKNGFDPWDALNPAQKVETLGRMIEREVARVVPALIAQP